MLAGVDQHRLEIGRIAKRVPERRHLHEVGARGGDQVDAGGPCSVMAVRLLGRRSHPLYGACDKEP
jgi:hypothetical protein